MEGRQHNGGWQELARCPAPVDRRVLWKTLIDKTEHPERYNASVRRADLIDHNASVVVRRTYPGNGEPFVEWVQLEARRTRVETRRSGCAWKRAQAIVDTPDGPCLIYEVDDADAADVDSNHASRVLAQLLAAAQGRAV